MYSHYKPLRNFVRELDRNTAFLQLFQFFQNIQYGKPLPNQFARLNPKGLNSIKGVVFQWELDILVREVILHSGSKSSKNLFLIKDFVTVIALIRKIQDRQIGDRLPKMIYQELHRLFQQQFPWQTKSVELRLSRYLRIYRFPEVETLLVERTGLTVRKFFLLGGAMTGAFLSNSWYDLNTNFTQFGISNEQRDAFFRLVTIDFESLKERTQKVQEYNENWSYTINPLRRTPLVRISSNAPNVVICPIPEFMLLRISEGLFFDLCEAKGFENPYGAAFEQYFGEISIELITSKAIQIEAGREYSVKKNRKKGVDWLVFDKDAAMLIECKSKGLRLDARYQLEEAALFKEIDLLAKFIFQNYKNLLDISAGYTHWQPGGRVLYPVVVTLSNWYLSSPSVFKRLEERVLFLIDESDLDRKIIENYPYIIMSMEEYELAVQIVAQVGLSNFFDSFINNDYKGWMVSAFMQTRYVEELSNCRLDYLRSETDSIIKYMEGLL